MMRSMFAARCPHCFARWALPPDRIGGGGASVRCGRCERTFVWRPPIEDRGAPAVSPGVSWDPAEWFDDAPDDEPRGGTVPHGSVGGLAGPASAGWVRGAASSAVDELDPEDATPAIVARLAVEELVNAGSDALLDAYDRGALFERCGPAVLEAWLRCRARLGERVDPALFRAALEERLGIELPGWKDRG